MVFYVAEANMSAGAISGLIEELIEEIEEEGYDLEMTIMGTASPSIGSQRRLASIIAVSKKLEAVKKFAESKGL